MLLRAGGGLNNYYFKWKFTDFVLNDDKNIFSDDKGIINDDKGIFSDDKWVFYCIVLTFLIFLFSV